MALRLVTTLLLAMALSACASSGVYTPYPFPMGGPKPAPTPPAVAPPVSPTVPRTPIPTPARTTDGYALSSTALSLRGAPYVNGGADPDGFDCSGFVQYVFGQNGVRVPRDVKQQYKSGKEIDLKKLEPGDLLFFTTVAPGASHVGIAIGGDQFVHAPSERGVVRVEQLSSSYWSSRFIGARRVD